MSQKNQLSILEFSRLTGIKRENLRFYDRIGLLSPETRGENNYRYYSRHQLNTAYLISSLRGLGVGIEDIKKYTLECTSEKTLDLFARQDLRIQAEIRHLLETSQIMRMHSDMIREVCSHEENALFLQERKREAIFLCPPIPEDMEEDEEGIFSYNYAEENGINLGFPQGSLIGQERLKGLRESRVDRYYFKVVNAGNYFKPAGLYAVGYGTCDPWKTEAIYRRLLEFIEKEGLCICGDAYEEYPMGDSAVLDAKKSCVRVEIQVEKVRK